MDSSKIEQAGTWRPATVDDLSEMQRIADQIHVDLPERPEVIAEKLELFSKGCFVLVRRAIVVGYGLSHPWLLNRIPPLDELLRQLPSSPECLLIHDVAVLQEARGHGAAGNLIERLADLAKSRGIPRLALVSVYGTRPLWARLGFHTVADAALKRQLKPYGKTANYMIRKLA